MRNAMISNNYFMPTENCALCTITFMDEVRLGKTFCPRLNKMVFMHCGFPPSTETLRNTIIGVIRDPKAKYVSNAEKASYLSLAKHLEKKDADQKFLLGLLSTI